MLRASKIKLSIIVIFTLILNIQNLNAFENKILFKIDNEIITTIDIYEEIKFLKVFNPEINSLSDVELFEISKNSLIKDKIKKIEIMKFVKELKIDDKFLLKLIKRKYSKLNINSIKDFEKYLKKENLSIEFVKEKFIIELMWNDLIYQKFNKKVVIDKERIKKEISQNSQKKFQKEYLISEIVFNVANKDEFNNKYQKILLDIEKVGFKKTALIHSNSDSATNGGLIGWVKEVNLNKNLKKVISELKPGQFSKPVRTSSGFIIIKIDEEKEYVSKFNLADKIDEIIRFKTNEQLNQFSNMYLNKLKKNLIIYGL
ncbi:peptidylprolyl isomerase [Candidatus Pelagibacter sp.]|uniref:peptidylprolyl isomerase n=1 Tax=Candidatus Pelagibacter sp. TaxID=2024849 RepID=UPI003F847659